MENKRIISAVSMDSFVGTEIYHDQNRKEIKKLLLDNMYWPIGVFDGISQKYLKDVNQGYRS